MSRRALLARAQARLDNAALDTVTMPKAEYADLVRLAHDLLVILEMLEE